jgi:hypothetical protein
MSNGPPIGFCSSFAFDSTRFCFGFTSNASNIVQSTNGCDMFVDYVGSGQLFIDSSFVSKNVWDFFELDVPICSPNLFGQYFDPYISLGLEQYGISSSSCSTNDVFVHPSTFNVVSYASSSIMCPTSITMSCTPDC